MEAKRKHMGVFFGKHIDEWTNYSGANNMPLLSGWGHHCMCWHLSSRGLKGFLKNSHMMCALGCLWSYTGLPPKSY